MTALMISMQIDHDFLFEMINTMLCANCHLQIQGQVVNLMCVCSLVYHGVHHGLGVILM